MWITQEIWQERFGLDRAGESLWSSRLTYQDDDHHHDRHPPPHHHPKSLPWPVDHLSSPSSSMVGTCRRQNPAMLIADNSSPWVEFGHGGNKPWSWWWSRWPSSRGALHTRWEPIPFQQVSQTKPNDDDDVQEVSSLGRWKLTSAGGRSAKNPSRRFLMKIMLILLQHHRHCHPHSHQCGWQWCRQWPLKMLKFILMKTMQMFEF